MVSVNYLIGVPSLFGLLKAVSVGSLLLGANQMACSTGKTNGFLYNNGLGYHPVNTYTHTLIVII